MMLQTAQPASAAISIPETAPNTSHHLEVIDMPTEEELEQYITARIDREEAAQADHSLESAEMDR